MGSAAKKIEFNPSHGDRFKDLPMESYHKGPGISKSGLDKVAQSPLHYWDAYLNPNGATWEETRAQMLGSAIHCLVLEPEKFSKAYVVPPSVNRRTNAGKAEWAEWESNNKGKVLLDDDQMETVKQASSAILKHSLAASYLSAGTPEESFYWEDDLTGELCKSRPDYNRDAILCDVKTTTDASLKAFGRTATNFRYHVSDSFSCHGFEKVTGIKPAAYKFIVVEVKPPYGVAIYDLDMEAKERGYELWRRDLDLFAECKQKNNWPAYGDRSQVLSLPGYAFFD